VGKHWSGWQFQIIWLWGVNKLHDTRVANFLQFLADNKSEPIHQTKESMIIT
jgi:hypothetical protein